MDNFEVLIGEKDFLWEPASDGGVPAGAVTTGKLFLSLVLDCG